MLTLSLWLCMMSASGASIPAAIWTESNGTLTFATVESTNIKSYNSAAITNMYVNDEVVNVSQGEWPKWHQLHNDVKTVRFDSSFSGVQPTNMAYWFYDFTNLNTIYGIQYLNTSKCENMKQMFQGCSSLTDLTLKTFNTSLVTDMTYMFQDCEKLTNLDVSGFNTGKVTDMRYMFADCKQVRSLDVTSFNTSNVTSMNHMFYNCAQLRILDVTNFNTKKVTDMSWMFAECGNLDSIYCDDAWNYCTSTNMFLNCKKLVGYIPYIDLCLNATYANPDNGYFTYKNVEAYDLWILGHRVTSKNCKDLTVLNGVSVENGGKVYYNPEVNLLWLQDAKIEGQMPEYLIKSAMEILFIEVIGKNTLNITSEEGGNGMVLSGHTYLEGGGTLDISPSPYKTAIYFGGKLAFNNVTVHAEAYKGTGIKGFLNDTPGIIKILGDRTKVYARGGNEGSVIQVVAIEFDGKAIGGGITSPANAVLDKGIVTVDGEIVKETVVIQSPEDKYGLQLCGVDVSDWNCDDLTVIDGVSDYSNKYEEMPIKNYYTKYDPETKTLWMNGTYINSEETGLSSSVDGLTINVVSESGILSSGSDAVKLLGNTTITGNGPLSCFSTSSNGNGISIGSATDLTVENKILYAVGNYGIHCARSVSAVGGRRTYFYLSNINVKDFSTVLAMSAEGNSGIHWARSINLDGGLQIYTDLEQTKTGTFKSFNVYDSDDNLAQAVMIAHPLESYSLWINGKQVTSENCREIHDISGIGIKKTYDDQDIITRYDPTTKTLTLFNANINAASGIAIQSDIYGMTLEMGQTFVINNDSNSPAVSLGADATITRYGDIGSAINSLANTGLRIGAGNKVTFDNAYIGIGGKMYGIGGTATRNAGGILYQSKMEVKGGDTYILASGEEGSIVNLGSLNFNESDGIGISSPNDAKLFRSSVCVGTETVKGLVIIEVTRIKGDVNEDRNVDISDIVAVINQIAGTATWRYADVNEDEHVDISDIVAIINIIAGQ